MCAQVERHFVCSESPYTWLKYSANIGTIVGKRKTYWTTYSTCQYVFWMVGLKLFELRSILQMVTDWNSFVASGITQMKTRTYCQIPQPETFVSEGFVDTNHNILPDALTGNLREWRLCKHKPERTARCPQLTQRPTNCQMCPNGRQDENVHYQPFWD